MTNLVESMRYKAYQEAQREIRYHRYCATLALKQIDEQVVTRDCSDLAVELRHHDTQLAEYAKVQPRLREV